MSQELVTLKTCWLLPNTGEVVIGNDSNDVTKPDMNHIVFNMNDWMEKAVAYKQSPQSFDHDETVVAGWNPEYHDSVLNMDRIRNDVTKSKAQKAASYSGIIRPEYYQNIQMAATNVAVFRPTLRKHALLQTVQTRTVNDLNGIEFLTIDPIDQDVVQEDLKWNDMPYEVSNFGLSSSTMNVKRYGYAWSVSEELRLTRFKLDIESEILGQLAGVLDLHKNKWVASIINGISATAENDWTAKTSGIFNVNAFDDVKVPLDAINGQYQSPPANFYSTKAVADAYIFNQSQVSTIQTQQIQRAPYSFGNGQFSSIPLIDGITWTYDDLLTEGRLVVTSADAITHLTGPQKLVNFTNKDQSEFGTMVKAYYNIEITRPSLISAISGVLG